MAASDCTLTSTAWPLRSAERRKEEQSQPHAHLSEPLQERSLSTSCPGTAWSGSSAADVNIQKVPGCYQTGDSILPRGHFHSPADAAPPALAGAQHPAGSAPYLLPRSLYGSIIISFTGAVTLLTN